MDLSLLIQISQVQSKIIRYEEPVILVIGNLGNLANILTFSRRDLRKNVCSWYFICLSIAHLFLLDTLCLTRIITANGINIFQYITSLCKLRAYSVEFGILLSRYFLCLISIDRWMVTSSNAWLRQQSCSRVCRCLIIMGVLFLALFSLHAAIGYQPTFIECTAPIGSDYALFVSIEGIVISMVPMFFMSLFSVLTVQNVRVRINMRIHTTITNTLSVEAHQQTSMSNEQLVRQRLKRNMQLVRLSLIQVLFYFMLNSLWSMLPIYIFLTTNKTIVTLNQQLTILFLGRLGLNLLFTYMSITFLMYTLASKAFRNECSTTIKKWLIKIQRYR